MVRPQDTNHWETYRLHGKLPAYRRRVEEARGIIRDSLRLLRRPYVAFSCGKDSSVMAHMILDADPSVPLRFLSSGETRLILNVDDVLQWFRSRGAGIEEINIDRVFSPEWQDATWDEQRKAGRRDLNIMDEGGWDGVYLGLRAEESPQRARTVYGKQTLGLPEFCYRYETGRREGMIRVCPLSRWTARDVAAYIHEHGIPLLDDYRRHGISARTTARLTGDAVRNGKLLQIRQHDPEVWNRLVQRFPEFRAFT